MNKQTVKENLAGIIHETLSCMRELMMTIIFSLPRHKVFSYIKKVFLMIMGATIGNRVVIYPGVWIDNGRNLVVGDDVDLALDVIVTTKGGVEIGDRTLVGYRTQILSVNHKIPNREEKIFYSGHVSKKVVIGSDVWIGANCIILPGVTIEEGAVVAAGAVVTKNVKPYSIVAGVPATEIDIRR